MVITLVKAKNAEKLIEAAAAEEARQRAALIKDRDPRKFPHPGDVLDIALRGRVLVTRVEKQEVAYLGGESKKAVIVTRRDWRKLAAGSRVVRVVSARGELHTMADKTPSPTPVPRLRWPGFQPMVGDIMEHLDNGEQREVSELASITDRLWFQILRKGKPWGSKRYIKRESWSEWCKRAKVVRRAEEIGVKKKR